MSIRAEPAPRPFFWSQDHGLLDLRVMRAIGPILPTQPGDPSGVYSSFSVHLENVHQPVRFFFKNNAEANTFRNSLVSHYEKFVIHQSFVRNER